MRASIGLIGLFLMGVVAGRLGSDAPNQRTSDRGETRRTPPIIQSKMFSVNDYMGFFSIPICNTNGKIPNDARIATAIFRNGQPAFVSPTWTFVGGFENNEKIDGKLRIEKTEYFSFSYSFSNHCVAPVGFRNMPESASHVLVSVTMMNSCSNRSQVLYDSRNVEFDDNTGLFRSKKIDPRFDTYFYTNDQINNEYINDMKGPDVPNNLRPVFCSIGEMGSCFASFRFEEICALVQFSPDVLPSWGPAMPKILETLELMVPSSH